MLDGVTVVAGFGGVERCLKFVNFCGKNIYVIYVIYAVKPSDLFQNPTATTKNIEYTSSSLFLLRISARLAFSGMNRKILGAKK
jgi:hypothetical protein